jgi:hypothetical protein
MALDIDIQLSAQISKVSAKVTAKEGVIKRTVKIELAREFDVPLAAALGTDAKKTLALLEAGSISEATIPIDAIVARGELVCEPHRTTIKELRGVQVKAKGGDEEEGSPTTVKLEFEFDWTEQSWVFLGRNLSALAEVTIRSLQLELPSVDKPTNRRGKRARAEA